MAPSRIFFISFKIKPDVTFIGFTTKTRMFIPCWYQNCKKCKVDLPIRIWIWLKCSWNPLICSWFSLLLSRGRSNRIINHNIPITKKSFFSICIRIYQFLQRIQLHKVIWPSCVTVEFPLSFGFSLTQVLMPFLPFFLNVTLFTSLQVMFHQYLTAYPPFNCTKKFYVDPSIEVL